MDTISVLIMVAGIGAAASAGLAAWVFVRRAQPKRRPSVDASLPALDSRLAQGIAYRELYRPRAKNSPPSITLTAELRFPAPISFKAESPIDRLGKALGLSTEVQTGDEAFDAAIYVDSPYPDYAARMLADADNRRALRRCFAAVPGLRGLACQRGGVRFLVSPAPEKELPEAQRNELLACLPGLLGAVQRSELPPQALREHAGAWLMGAAGLLAALGIVAMIWGLAAYPSLDMGIFGPALAGGLLGAALWSVVSFLLMRGRSGALLPFFVSSLVGLFASAFIGIGGLHLANGLVADTPLSVHEVSVTGTHYSRGKNSTSYYLDFEPWREGMDTTLQVSYEWYRRAQPGDRLLVESRLGRLGYEILLDFREAAAE